VNTALHHEYDPAPAPLKFERRTTDRHVVDGMATAFSLTGDRFGDLHDLLLLDYGGGGLGAVSDRPIEPGTTVSLGFADPTWLARRGVVKRCVPCGEGYQLGIQFQMGLAA
jgi:hypothetical protein